MRDRRRHVWAAIHIYNVLIFATATASPLYIPQFLSGGTGRNIRHLPCVSTRTGETGVCMFAFTCAKANGTHLGTCIDRFYFGSCCKIDQEPDAVFPQDNTIEDGPLPPPKPLFTTTPSSIESNEIPPYFTKVKPILEIRPTFSGLSTQRIETTTSKITETITTKPQKVTSKKPIIYTTTESVGLFTFQTVQDTSDEFQGRPTDGISQGSTPSTGRPSSTGKPSGTISTIGTLAASRRPPTTSFPSSIPSSSSSSSSSVSTVGTSSTTFSPRPTFDTSSTIGSTSTFASPSTIGSSSTAGSSTSGFPSTSSISSTIGSSTTFSTIPTSSSSSSTSHQRPTVVDFTTIKNLTQTSESSTATTATKPVQATKAPSITSTTTKAPSTRFPPRNATTIRPTTIKKPTSSSSATKKPTSTTVTKRPTVSSTSDTKKPIATTRRPATSATRPTSQTDAVKPSSPSKPPKPTKPTRPLSSSTKLPSSTGRPVTEIPFGGFKPTPKKPIVDKTPTKTTTAKPSTTTTRTKAPTKPTKTSSAKPSPGKPSSTTGSITTIRSTPKPTTTTDRTKPTTTTQIVTKLTTPSTTSTIQVSTSKTPVPTTSTESNIYIPLNDSTSTKPISAQKKPEDESAQTTNAPGLVTWTSTLDETTTNKIPEVSSSSEETEWAPITTPDGWVIIQSPTTEKEETSSSPTPKPSVATTSVPFFPHKPVTEIPTVGTFITTRPVIPTTLSSIATVTVSTESPDTIIPSINMSDYKQVCGRRLYPEGRIVGGKSGTFGKWPWQISLRQWKTSTYLHKCGAALLNENWAITAAHCVENVPPSDLLLRMGEHDLSNENEPYGYQERRVQLVASHPQFDPRTFEYDLTLLRFYEPIQPFQPNILPICLPDDDEKYVGHTAYVTGWGRLYEDGPLPSVLQEATVPVVNNTQCESMYSSAGFEESIPQIFICAGLRNGGLDSCEGDSGGPMVIQRPRDKRWILAGVISWGIGCAEPNQPGVYTRISHFRDWINQILQF